MTVQEGILLTSKDEWRSGKRFKKAIHAEAKQYIKALIESFHRILSHSCRRSTSKEYHEPGVSLTKLYKNKMYKESVLSKPKIKKESTSTETFSSKSTDHIKDELKHNKIGILTSKVIQLLSVSICRMSFRVLDRTSQPFFFKSKQNCFNMTWHCFHERTSYSVVWRETTAGRDSNEIATAFSSEFLVIFFRSKKMYSTL